MERKELAKLAAKNKDNLPDLIASIVESLENTGSRINTIENVIKELVIKLNKIDKILQDNPTRADLNSMLEKISILEVWQNTKETSKKPPYTSTKASD